MLPNQPAHTSRKSIYRRVAGILLKILLAILVLLILLVALVQTPFIQDIIREKGQKYLSGKLHTRVEIGKLYIGFPHTILLKNIYIEDRQKDTLLSGGLIQVDMDMWKLFHGEVDIEEIHLENLTAKVKRQLPDTVFNFQFIADAFGKDDSKKTPAPKDTSALQIAIHSILLDSVCLVYKDTTTGNDIEAWIGHSSIKPGLLNLARQQYAISSIQFANTTARIYLHTPLVAEQIPAEKPHGPQRTPLQLQLSKILLNNIALDYRNEPSALSANIQLGGFNGSIKSIDLEKQVIGLDELELDNTTAAISSGKKIKTISPKKDTAGSVHAGWRITANAVVLTKNNIQYDDDNMVRQKYGMDYAHIKAEQISLSVNDFLYSEDSISGTVTKGQLKEQSGFELDQLQARFLYAGNQAYLKDLILRTPGTMLKQSTIIHYPYMEAISHDPGKMNMDVDLHDSRIQLKDILTFVPGLRNQPLFKDSGTVLQIESRMTGNTGNLEIKKLQCSGFTNTNIDLSGTLRNITDNKKIYADLVIRNITSGAKDIRALAPRGSIPENITVPQQLNINGSIKGGMSSMYADIILHSTSGSLSVKGSIAQFNNSRNAVYDVQVQTKDLDLGLILQNPENLGPTTAAFAAKGKGFTPESAHAVFTGNIRSVMLKKYNYQNLQLHAAIADSQLHATVSVNDKNARVNLTASALFPKKFPSVKIDMQIDTLDLYALHLVKDSLQLKGNLNADFADTNPDSLQGNMRIANLLVINNKQRFTTDSILLTAARTGDGEDIRLRSEMADIDWKGHYKITEAAAAINQTINTFYRIKEDTSAKLADQDWQMKATLRPSPLVLAFMPSLKGTDSIGAFISFNGAQKNLHISVAAPRIKYGNTIIRKANIEAYTSNRQLRYRLQVDDAVSSGFQFYHSSVYGYAADNKLFTSVLLKDEKEKDIYRLSGKLDKLKDGLKFTLDADSLLLNYDKWQVSRDNFFAYDSSGLVINNFKINNNNQSLQINSASSSPSSPVTIVFTDFSIASIARFVNQDSLLADGILNGKVEVKNILSNPVFTSDLLVKNLSYKKDTIGDLALKVNNEETNVFAADISIEGNRNDIRMKGKYYTGESRMDMKLDLGRVNLAAFKPFASAQLQDITGSLKGNLSATGTMDKPVLDGNLHFDSTVITPLISGEPLKLSNDNIEFDKDGFNFNDFVFLDSANNKATVDGNVYTSDFRNYKFDVTFSAKNFRLVNAPQSGDRLFYGKLNVDAAANVSGDPGSPKLDGNIRVNKKTDFTLVLPSSDPEVMSREGVVRFVDKDHPRDTLTSRIMTDSFSRETQIKGMDIAANIETDSSALFTLVIDERSGDALSVRGRSDLSFTMDKSGKMSLTGNYEVESGTYNLSLDVLKRKFDIQRGSTITWTGDPRSATLALTATYSANSPPIDLVEPELAGRSQTEINKFKQKLPFLVTLKMEGELLKPVITFDISLPDNVLTLWPDVDTKLQQVRSDASELNKQVFALLLLNRFVGENPLESASDGLNAGTLAFQSASQILSNQLNNFAGSLIKGVDINFDLNNEQDYSTGQEQNSTVLNVSVSKRLFNDRVRVNVGSNFELQGPTNPNQNASNLAGDMAIDYKLSEDGRYIIRAYRKNQYDLVVEGQVIETGVSFILTLDYNKLNDIFRHTSKQKKEAGKSTPGATKQSTQ